MKKRIVQIIAIPVSLIVMTLNAFSVEKPYEIDYLEVSAGMTAISGDETPLLMWINQNARIPFDEGTEFFRFRMGKERDKLDELSFFYGIDLTGQTGGDERLRLTDAYLGVASDHIRITAGKQSEFIGLVDKELSAGSEVYSRNAPTIPKISISTNGYVPLSDNIAINAYLAHGWLGDERYNKDAFLHEKYLYVRFGGTDPDQGLNFFTGIHHIVVWGGTNRVTGVKNPSGLGDYARVFFGLSGDDNSLKGEQENSLGNHLGSIEFALQLKDIDNDWFLYAQTMFEDPNGLLFIIPGDFLVGASYISKNSAEILQRANIEYLDIRNNGYQPYDETDAGYHDMNYFSNNLYKTGWSYKGYAIGHPFVRFLPGDNYIYYPQNKLWAINASAALRFSDLLNPVLRFAYIKSHGSFREPLESPESLYAADVVNVSNLANGWLITQQVSWDSDNDFGVGLSVTKKIF